MDTLLENRADLILRLEGFTYKNPKTGCWKHLGKVFRGHSKIEVCGVEHYVHRLSAMLFLGYVPGDNFQVLHKCSTKSCWNPEHLYIGTPKQNVQDTINAGGMRNQYSNATHCIRGHALTKENTYFCVRKSTGRAGRQCKICHKARRGL